MCTSIFEFNEQTGKSGDQVQIKTISTVPDRWLYVIYALALAGSISIWFIAVRSPLWLDETVSFWQIHAGFSGIWSRQWNAFPAYLYVLWLATKILGTGAIAMRIPSILAMLGTVYLLYRVARELFDANFAIVAAIIFCVHRIVIFESIDARPYAFAVLVTVAAIYALIRLRHNASNGSAALFGFLSAVIVYFHYLFAVILPAFAICFYLVKRDDRKALWRQACVALAAFALAFLPVIPGLEYLFRTRTTHVFAPAPSVAMLIFTVAPLWMLLILGGTALIANRVTLATSQQNDLQCYPADWRILFCALLGFVPLLTLYSVSVATPIHVFVFRYRLVAIPGIALFWAWVVSRANSHAIKLAFCVLLVIATACIYLRSPVYRHHGYSWKYALAVAEKDASTDNAPVLMCSDVPESNFTAMPIHSAKESNLFAPLSYYKLSVPVVPLPRALDQQAILISSSFLKKATHHHERFLAIAYEASYKTLEWIEEKAAPAYTVHKLGIFDGVKVLEFTPHRGNPHTQ